jgi:alkylation response protein AidB-like acyl-CoA dehydrogenase
MNTVAPLSPPALEAPITLTPASTTAKTDWVKRIRELGPAFAARAAGYDENDAFVAENYAALKAARVFSAGVPAALGGGDASYEELCELVRVTAHYCSATALSLSMHFHLVAATVWKWRHLKAPVEKLLERAAREQLVLVTSGGSDWLVSSGKAEEVDGGYRINARKIFSSGSPAGDLLLTSAVYDDPEAGPTVLHFPIALNHPQVKILSTWRTLGMRGTGSNDVLIENVFVPAEAVNLRRPRGRWHPALHLVSKVALPMVYSAYVGIAEAARDLALREVQSKRENVETQFLAGEMENELFNARLAHERLVDIGASWQPGMETTDAVLKARTLAGQAAIQTVEKAVELVGGRSFYRSLGLERLYRDVQAARFHPLPEKLQHRFAGRVALGLSPDA